MVNALIVVWRESLEAMLVIGVLSAWLTRQHDRQGLGRALWLGVAGGVLLALALAVLTFAAQSGLQGEALEIFQLTIVFFAAGLILQMVAWMRRHGRDMKRQLEAGANRASEGRGRLGLAIVAALAVGREGAETVVFLYGLGVEQHGGALSGVLLSALAGLVLAGLTAWLVTRGARFLSYRVLFGVSEILLLLVAAALLSNGIDRLIGLDWLPPLIDPLWDSSAILDDTSGLGRILADFAGYRARPSASLLIAYCAFWAIAWWRLRLSSHTPAR